MSALDSELPNKRQKTFAAQDDFVSLDEGSSYHRQPASPPHVQYVQHVNARTYTRPHALHDRPKSKHALPGCEPWLLVKTRLRRRFVHNPETKQSLWRIPAHVLPAVLAWEQSERDWEEKAENAAWAELQLQQMRPQPPVGQSATSERRRRSVSLQREDEAALMAELAAQAGEVLAPLSAHPTNLPAQAATYGYDSDGSYEEVEVTDDDEEDEGTIVKVPGPGDVSQPQQPLQSEPQPGAPVEFGEDDIAWQLAAMGEDYGLDAGEYGDEPEGGWEEGAEGLGLTEEDAINLFRDLLDDYRISPFTPWENIIADESGNSILSDDRYTVLPNMKARREAFDAWAKDKAAHIKAERAAMHKLNPRIPYLAFLQEKASPKLYWPEFKRKYKREAEMNDRKLSDKDREKLYRDHIARTKLPESTRQADIKSLLNSVPLTLLNSGSTLDSLPEQVLSHVHYISLPPKLRDPIVLAHIRGLPAAPEHEGMDGQEQVAAEAKRQERRRREQALADRESKVREDRQCQQKIEERARRELREGQRELERAMIGNRGVHS